MPPPSPPALPCSTRRAAPAPSASSGTVMGPCVEPNMFDSLGCWPTCSRAAPPPARRRAHVRGRRRHPHDGRVHRRHQQAAPGQPALRILPGRRGRRDPGHLRPRPPAGSGVPAAQPQRVLPLNAAQASTFTFDCDYTPSSTAAHQRLCPCTHHPPSPPPPAAATRNAARPARDPARNRAATAPACASGDGFLHPTLGVRVNAAGTTHA